MLDNNLLRNDPEKVKENIRKKFQDQKLVLVDEVVALDKEYRESRQQADALRRLTLPAGQGGQVVVDAGIPHGLILRDSRRCAHQRPGS